MTPSFIGRIAWMSPGVRPIISRASCPTATMPFDSDTATTDGSWMTMPLPSTKTSTLAVPRSMPIFMVARSCRLGRRLDRGPAFDARPELDELVLDVLVATLHVDRPGDGRATLRGEGGEDEAGAGAQVRHVQLGAAQRCGTPDTSVVRVLDLDSGSHALELRGVFEAILEDRLVDAALALGL